MNITSGKIQSAQKVVIYGPEGIGKSTFASKFPQALFIDTEGSTKQLNVSRFDKPTSWELLKQQIDYVKQNKPCKTLIIDTIDWAEQLCIDYICASYDKKGIEDFGYGNGYVYEKEEVGRFLNSLEELIHIGINVVLTAHAQLRKFEQPDELGAYDRWELKLGKKTSSQISPLIKEWADMVLFANYKTYAVQTDKDGKKFKAQGGTRVMFTEHHPCWDAKNRFELKPELPFDYSEIAFIFGNAPMQNTPQPQQPQVQPQVAPSQQQPTQQPVQQPPQQTVTQEDINTSVPIGDVSNYTEPQISPDIPKALADLMIANSVTEKDIQVAVSQKGYYPESTPVANYDSNFINGVLVGAWEQVYAMIKANKSIPF